MIYDYMSKHRVPDETCQPYVAKNEQCLPENVCRNCFPVVDLPKFNKSLSEDCFAVDNYVGYGVGDSGNISGELAMQKEIFARGPIACSIQCPDDFVYSFAEVANATEGVYSTEVPTDPNLIDHIISVSGWGVTPGGLKYWLVRNSWGTYWGDEGWFKIRRGTNHLSIEEYCTWAVPDLEELDETMHNHIMGDYYAGLMSDASTLPAEKLAISATSNHVQLPVVVAFASGVAVTLSAVFVSHLALRRRLPRQPAGLLG